jgi:ATP-dependent RNA helicase SUPV3L1/SUV3
MLNLLGCNKEDFKKLLKNMGYKINIKDNDIFFKYIPPKKTKKNFSNRSSKENPFKILKNLNLSK